MEKMLVNKDSKNLEGSLFLGQNPNRKNKSLLRIVKPIFLKGNSFAYDLWEWKINSYRQFEVSGLYYEGIRDFLYSSDYFKREISENSHLFILEKDNIIEQIFSEKIKDVISDYIIKLPKVIEFEFKGVKYYTPKETLRNIYLKQQNNVINDNWLTNLNYHDKIVLRDTKKEAFFAFNNGLVEVTKNEIKIKSYSNQSDLCVWKDQIIDFDICYNENKDRAGEFRKFICNVCNRNEQRFSALCSAIGYLLHNYHSPSKGQAVILYDEELTTGEKPMGGTGKGVIANALKIMRSTAKIDGKNFKSDNNFKWSNISPSTQLVWIDETNKKFNFDILFSCLTDGWQIEQKYRNKFDIPAEDSPKVLICSNTILENKGASNLRRQFTVELSDYYSKRLVNGTETPISDEHGGDLFSDNWDFEEWNLFYSFMLDCVKYYLKNGLCDYERINVERNWLIQKTCEEFVEYIHTNPPRTNDNFFIKTIFFDFKSNYQTIDEHLAQRTFTNWLKDYCESKKYKLEKTGKSNGEPVYQIREQGNNKH
jgi:hypothetical protein